MRNLVEEVNQCTPIESNYRMPKLPVNSFLRYHMERFNLVKSKHPLLNT